MNSWVFSVRCVSTDMLPGPSKNYDTSYVDDFLTPGINLTNFSFQKLCPKADDKLRFIKGKVKIISAGGKL
jgi:hypothetical protein